MVSAVQVDGENLFPDVFCHIAQPSVPSAQKYGGVVVQHIHSAVFFLDLGKCLFDGLLGGDIRVDVENRGELCFQRFAGLVVDVQNDDNSAFFGKLPCACTADAGSTAGNNDDFLFNSKPRLFHNLPLLF